MTRLPALALACALGALLAAGCSEKTKTVVVAPDLGSITIDFQHTVGGAVLVLDGAQYAGTDGAGNAYSVDELRYFVSNIRLHSEASGSIYGTDDHHYRDASIVATRDYTLSGIPEGTYDALSFTFGLDEQRNLSGNGIEADPNTNGMEWPPNWGGGWHYMILEGLHDPANGFGHRTHFGRRFIANAGDPSGQGPDDVAYHHFFTVRIDFGNPITIGGDSWETTVTMEIDDWFADPVIDLASLFPGGAGGIMVNLTVQNMLQQNGRAAFTGSQPVRR